VPTVPGQIVDSFVSDGTGYYPSSSALEGGFNDRRGVPLKTLQQYLAGNADYVAVAMDTNAFVYGTKLRITEFEQRYGRPIEFRVVDTGGAFRGKGRSRMDICVQNYNASLDATVNGRLHVQVVR
jgi:3D (Asp-Asp-Asp) domain-containing protein